MEPQRFRDLENKINNSLNSFENEFVKEKNNKIMIRQTEDILLLFIEILIIGISFLLLPFIPNIPTILLIFSTSYLNFGFTLFLLIPLNLILGQLLLKNRIKKLEGSDLINEIDEYLTKNTQFWKEIFSKKEDTFEKPSKEQIKHVIANNPNVKVDFLPLDYRISFSTRNKLTIRKTSEYLGEFEKTMILQQEIKSELANQIDLDFKENMIFKNFIDCSQKYYLLPSNSNSLAKIKNLIQRLSLSQIGQVQISKEGIRIVIRKIINPSNENLDIYESIPEVLKLIQQIR
ncbi:MAG: hypothetical protein ACTSUV_02765 [Candidatus Ranarchaeia archaeon]